MIHIDKEGTHVYQILVEGVSVSKQEKAVGIMAGTVPRERFLKLVARLFPLIGCDDRENVISLWQTSTPASASPPQVNSSKQKAIGATALNRRSIPSLALR